MWDRIAAAMIRPHPAYSLGWSRLSCRACIFGSPNQWATIRAVFPDQFRRIAAREQASGDEQKILGGLALPLPLFNRNSKGFASASSRVQAVVNELQGEKIDIIPWNADIATFLVNALQPAEVSKVVFDEEGGKIEVVVPDAQLSLAIGRRGQNVRLASQLTGLDIDIMTEADESARRQAEFAERTKLFMDTLDIDEMMAQLLVAEGFTNLEEVAYVEIEELLSIDGFDEGTAGELQTRAQEHIEEQNRKALENARSMGVDDSLIAFEGLTPQMLEALARDKIFTLEDFATCADWELAGGWTTENGVRKKDEGVLEKFEMSLEEAQHLVMTARVLLGWVDPTAMDDYVEPEGEDVAADEEAQA